MQYSSIYGFLNPHNWVMCWSVNNASSLDYPSVLTLRIAQSLHLETHVYICKRGDLCSNRKLIAQSVLLVRRPCLLAVARG